MTLRDDEKAKQVNTLCRCRELGAGLARCAFVLLCAAPSLTGCLVTDRIDFEVERNVPPVILDKPGTDFPIGHAFWIDLAPVTEPDAAERNEWSFDVTVRDENVDDELEARLRVRTMDALTPQFRRTPVEKTGGVNRTLPVTITRADLKDGKCHRVELVVSGSFLDRSEPLFFDVTNPADDIGEATWLVWEGKGADEVSPSEADAIVKSCDAVETFLEEAAP